VLAGFGGGEFQGGFAPAGETAQPAGRLHELVLAVVSIHKVLGGPRSAFDGIERRHRRSKRRVLSAGIDLQFRKREDEIVRSFPKARRRHAHIARADAAGGDDHRILRGIHEIGACLVEKDARRREVRIVRRLHAEANRKSEAGARGEILRSRGEDAHVVQGHFLPQIDLHPF